MAKNLCKNCKHFKKQLDDGRVDICKLGVNYKDSIDPVTGDGKPVNEGTRKYAFAADRRDVEDTVCGPTGLAWEAKT